ncbi:MAG TPA: hypothetical protein PK079_23835 [Leptospiraceae bacterium]|nr:hypothetical protein [Leptospiraceae bacterium]HMW07242.1 hypothetical protein [Leptospiraceae bacterium]HMY32608.1 hypothetical protein [Leptospiraceae bacterium]HMZ63765.1 hypothetical protein [Leptospiraceae bacterium]HNA08050.1 hypothetical protein [Leptospiraceae bacterium]
MNKTNKFIILISFLIFLFALEDIFLNITVDFDTKNVMRLETRIENEDLEEKPASLEIRKGIVFKIFFLNSLLKEVNDDYAPSDGKLEKTIEKIEGLLIGQKVKLFLNVFLIALCFSTVVSVLNNAWFAIFLQRVLLSVAFLTFSYYLARSIFLSIHLPFIGIPMLALHLPVYVIVCMSILHTFQKFFVTFFTKKALFFTTICLFGIGFFAGFFFLDTTKSSLSNSNSLVLPSMVIGISAIIYGLVYVLYLWLVYRLSLYLKLVDTSDYKFNALLLASFNDEENNARPTIKALGAAEPKKESSFLKIAGHFLLIIFAGVFVGNVVYIPLFSLQKHYTSQFGILLIVLLFLLCIFYVRNYYKIGKEEGLSVTRNILVSLSFLQYRFLKNLFFIVLSTVGVLVFITCLFLLLTMDTVILKNYNIIDKTINL